MDSSSSTGKEAVVNPNLSDKESALLAVFGDLRLNAKEFSTEQWLYMIRKVLDKCNPYMKYLPMFKPLGEGKVCFRSAFNERFDDEREPTYHDIGLTIPEVCYTTDETGITKRTKCFGLSAYVASKTPEGIETVHLIMIGDSGRLFCVQGVQDVVKKADGNKYLAVGFDNLDVQDVYFIHDYEDSNGRVENSLSAQISFCPTIGVYILRNMSFLLRLSVSGMIKRLSGIKGVSESLELVMSHLDFSELNPWEKVPGAPKM
jgi:hypothetical protein